MRPALVLAALALTAGASADVDKAALRATLTLPSVELRVSFDTGAYRREFAKERLTELQPDLLKDGENPKVLIQVAQQLHLMEEFDAAKQYFKKTLKALSTNTSPKAQELAWEAEAQVRCAEFAAAETAVRRLEAFDGAAGAYWKAVLRFNASLAEVTEGARSDFSSRLADRGFRDRIRAWIGKSGDLKALAQRAIDKNPNDKRAYRQMADVLNAISAFQTGLDQAEGKPGPFAMLTDEAAKYLKEVFRLDPDDLPEAAELYAYRLTLDASKHPDAEMAKIYDSLSAETKALIARIETSFEVASKGKGVRANLGLESLGVACAMRGDYPAAVGWLDKAIAANPNELRLPLLKLDVLLMASKYPEAGELGHELLKKLTAVEIQIKTAKAHDLGGKKAEAEALILDALAKNPDSPTLRFARAIYLLRSPTGDLTEASSVLNELAQVQEMMDADFREDVTFARAVFLGLLGETSEAKRLVERLIKAHPKEEKYGKAKVALGI